MRKNRICRGFTLIELIVVIAVLAIIAMLVIPSFAGLKDSAKESVCKANRETVAREIAVKEATENRMLTQQEISNIINSHGDGLCPAGGKISVSYQSMGNYTVLCSVHSDSARLSAAETVISNFSTLDPSKYRYSINSQLFEEYYNTFGGWQTFTSNGTTYYAKPYYNSTAKQMTVYANYISNDSVNWMANLIYHDGKWYGYKTRYNMIGTTYMGSYTWESFQQAATRNGATLIEVTPDK